MTRGDTTEILAKHDPDYLRHRKRERRWIVLVVCLAVVALCGAAYAVRSAFRVETRVTEIRQLVESPCLEYGSHSRQCEEAFEAAVASINHREACFVGQKMGIHPRSCEGSHLRAAALPPRGPTVSAPPEGVMPSTPSKGHSQPAPGDGGSGNGGGNGGHLSAPSVPGQTPHNPPSAGGEAPSAAPTAPSSSQPPASSPTEPAPEAEPPVRSAAGGVVEALKPTVEGLGEAVGGTVEGVEATGCELGKVPCGG